MSKRFLFLTGALAIMLAFALNLRHASSSYGLRDSTFLPFVEVLGTETGSPGTVYCLGVSCVVVGNCEERIQCFCQPTITFDYTGYYYLVGYGFTHTENGETIIVFDDCGSLWCIKTMTCDVISFGTKFSQMSSEMPTHTNWVYGGQNGTCFQWCGGT